MKPVLRQQRPFLEMIKKMLKNSQTGSALLLVVLATGMILVSTVLIIGGSQVYYNDSTYSYKVDKAGSLAEAGIDKAVAALNKSGGNYNGETETTLGDGSYSVTITNIDASTKQIQATGYLPNKTSPKVKRTVTIEVAKGSGLSFNYGILSGQGGFEISGGSTINGSVFSNNDLTMSGGAHINGTAQVAGGTQAVADQQTNCTNCSDYIFGKAVSGENRQDVTMSFTPSATAVINKVSLKLKKTGSPSNPTVRIMSDSGGKPNKNGVLTSGTLSANLVSTSYGFVDAAFTTNPPLSAGTTYWIMIHANSLDNSNYWYWSNDLATGYNGGSPKWSVNWQANPNPTWTSITGDLGFKTYMGGVATKIAGIGSSVITGNAYANTLSADVNGALQINGQAFYQVVDSNVRVSGQSCTNNAACHPNSPDPATVVLPISQSNIQAWKDEADDQVQNGDLTIQWPCNTTLNKKKYVGNVIIQGGCSIQIDSPVWITGNLTVQGGSTVSLKSSYGPASGVLVADGIINLTGGSKFLGSGTAGSYMTALSTYNSHTISAININGGNSSSIVYAGDGIVTLSGGATIRESTAWKIVVTGGGTVNYESGVANPFFSSGPSGSFTAIKGTYLAK